MNVATFILVFVVSWWMVFFIALPIGVRAQSETEDEVVAGTVPSAPGNPNLKKKVIYTTLAAVVLTTAYYFLATSGLISFRNPAP